MKSDSSSRSIKEALLGLLRTSVCALSLTMAPAIFAATVLTSGAALAEEEEDDASFGEKLIKNLMGGMGAVSPDDNGIKYRERSPLVVPPSLDLPQPEKERAAAPNWPKDPDIAERKARREANKNRYRWDEHRTLSPSELNIADRARIRANTTYDQPGQPVESGPRSLSPSELGTKSNIFGKLFNRNSEEVAQFKGEPTRENLTQPPSGYQTPSPNQAYGVTGEAKPAPNNGTVALPPSQLR